MYSEPCATLPDPCNLLVVWVGWFPVPSRFERYSELLMPQSPIRFSTSTMWVSEIVVLRNLDTYWDKGRLRVVSKVIQKGAWHRKTHISGLEGLGWSVCNQQKKRFSAVFLSFLKATGHRATRACRLVVSVAHAVVNFDKSEACDKIIVVLLKHGGSVCLVFASALVRHTLGEASDFKNWSSAWV